MSKSTKVLISLIVICVFYLSARLYRNAAYKFSTIDSETFLVIREVGTDLDNGNAQTESHASISFANAGVKIVKPKFSSIHTNSSRTPMFRHAYQGTVLLSPPIKTEIVSAFFDFREQKQEIVVLGCQYHQYATQSHYHCLVKYSEGVEKCLTGETQNEHLSKPDISGSKNCWSYRFTCKLDNVDTLPIDIALTASATCQPPTTKWMHILDSRYEKYTAKSPKVKQVSLGVCFQSPLYLSSNWRGEVITEAVERYRVLGAEWFTIYYRENPSKDVMQAIHDYETMGILEAINMTVSTATFYDLRYYGELLTIRDCVYRNMYRAKYLAMTDIDEVIVPQSHANILDMISYIDFSKIGSFLFKHSAMMVNPSKENNKKYTCPSTKVQVTKPMFITHTFRTNPFPIPEACSVGRQKVIVKPLKVDLVSIHSVGKLLAGFRVCIVQPTVGLLYHYRHQPFFSPKICRSCHEDNKLSNNSGLADNYFARTCL